MAGYIIEFSRKAAKSYKRLPGNYKNLVDLALSKFSSGISADIKPVKGESDVFRIRVGKYRILLLVMKNSVIITRIGSRGDVYK